MRKHFFSIFAVTVSVLFFDVFAQQDGWIVDSIQIENGPIFVAVESEDGGSSAEMAAQSVTMPTLDSRFRLSNLGIQPGATVRMMGSDGNIGDGFTMEAGDDVFTWTPEIADALNLSPTQRDEIQITIKDLTSQYPHGSPAFAGVSEVGRHIAEMRESMNQTLNIEQQKKFSEITFQSAGGLDSLSLNDRMLECLELTSVQKKQIREIVTAREAETLNARQQFDFHDATTEERVAFFTANTERTKKFADQVKAVLTSAQRMKAEKLTAEIPALREKLGISPEGLVMTRDRPQAEQQTLKQPQQTAPPVYTPGPNSWRPGLPIPSSLQVPSEERPRRFPRSEN